ILVSEVQTNWIAEPSAWVTTSVRSAAWSFETVPVKVCILSGVVGEVAEAAPRASPISRTAQASALRGFGMDPPARGEQLRGRRHSDIRARFDRRETCP